MKKLLLSLFAAVATSFGVFADSYKVEFTTGSGTGNTPAQKSTPADWTISGSDYLTGTWSATGTFTSKASGGIGLGAKTQNSTGALTLNFSDKGKVEATKIVFQTSAWDASKVGKFSVKINDIAYDLDTESLGTQILSFTTPTKLESITLCGSVYRIFVSSFEVFTEAGGGETTEPVAPTELVVKYGDKTVAENDKVEVNKGTKFEISAKDATSIVVTDVNDKVLNDPTVYPCVWEPEVMAEELIFVTAKNGELEGASFGFELTVKDDGTVTPEPSQGDEYNFTVTALSNNVATLEYADNKTLPGLTFKTAKNNGQTSPTFYNDTELRIYAKGSLTVTVPADVTVTKLVFNLSEQGKKRLATITASVGTIATQSKDDETVTWTGSVSGGDIVLTVGAKADFGSDGSSSAGQLCFATGVITTPASGKTAAPEFSPAGGVLYKGEKFTLSCKTEGAIIKYSIDGGMEQTYSESIGFEDEGKYEISAYAYVEGEEENRSETVSATFTYAAVERPEIPEPVVDSLNPQTLAVTGTTYFESVVDNTEVSGAKYLCYVNGEDSYFGIRTNSDTSKSGAIVVTQSDKVVTSVSIKQYSSQTTSRSALVYGSNEPYKECSGFNHDNLPEGSVLIGEAAMIKGQHVAIELKHYYPYIMIIVKGTGALQCEEIKVTWEKRFDPPTVDFTHNGKLSEGGSVHFDFRHSFVDARTYYKHEPLQSAASAARKAPSHNDTDWEELTDDEKFVDIKEAGTLYAYSSDLSGKNRSHIARFDVTDENTTSISDVNVESNEPVMWFDLQGRRLAEPTRSGVYIRRQGSSVSKVRF